MAEYSCWLYSVYNTMTIYSRWVYCVHNTFAEYSRWLYSVQNVHNTLPEYSRCHVLLFLSLKINSVTPCHTGCTLAVLFTNEFASLRNSIALYRKIAEQSIRMWAKQGSPGVFFVYMVKTPVFYDLPKHLPVVRVVNLE